MTDLAHRMRCITTKAGVVNICPDCGHVTITDFHWDFARDPGPLDDPDEEVHICLDDDDDLADFVEVLRDIAPTVGLPCEDCECRPTPTAQSDR